MQTLIIDCDTERGENLQQMIANLNCSVVHHAHVWDTDHVSPNQRSHISQVKQFFWPVQDDTIVFIHHNDTLQQHWTAFVHEKCLHNLVILYSGEGVDSNYEKDNICEIRENIGNDPHKADWNLEGFFNAVATRDPRPFDVLVNYTPELETKLEFFHQCLTPEGAQTISRELIKEIENTSHIQFDHTFITAEWIGKEPDLPNTVTVNGAIETLKQEKDCFSPKYLGILSGLREVLLAK